MILNKIAARSHTWSHLVTLGHTQSRRSVLLIELGINRLGIVAEAVL